MPVTTHWEDESVLNIQFSDRWNSTDVSAAQRFIARQLDQHTGTLHILIGWENEHWLPADHPQLASDIVPRQHPNLGQVIYISQNRAWQQLLTVTRAMRRPHDPRLTFAPTVEAALTRLPQPILTT
jgi:hypothetical protein